ncbi:hypothetical protein C7212DRAFT_325935 [Tuber magnatum]|uniref:Uncharacterized protein n=1 Tax=Tuber magnatum TaxID=42249 RepID=A0A317SKR4_9PEZI|nr:hypothetical protein C7212DRAFT_325935 [Tuber magnatum]
MHRAKQTSKGGFFFFVPLPTNHPNSPISPPRHPRFLPLKYSSKRREISFQVAHYIILPPVVKPKLYRPHQRKCYFPSYYPISHPRFEQKKQ